MIRMGQQHTQQLVDCKAMAKQHQLQLLVCLGSTCDWSGWGNSVSIPNKDMSGFLPDFLDGLFNMLSDSRFVIWQQADSALSEFLQEIKNSPDDEAFVGKSSEDSEQVKVDTERSYHHHVVAILEELHAEVAGYVSYLREHLPKHVVLH